MTDSVLGGDAAETNWADGIDSVHSTVDTPAEPTEQEDPAAEEAPKETPEKKERRSTNGYLKKLGRAEAERDFERQQRVQLEERLAALENKSKPTESNEPPKPEDFEGEPDGFAKFLDAKDQYNAKQVEKLAEDKVSKVLSERDKQAQEQVYVQQIVKTYQSHAEKMQAYEAENPGTLEKLNELHEAGLTPEHVTLAVINQPNSVEVSAYLADNIEEAAAIARMQPQAAQLALTRISARLEQPATRQTQATPPVKPLKQNSGGSTKPVAEMSLSELDKKWKPLN